LRSIIASLLFVVLFLGIIVEFIFTVIRVQNLSLPRLIDKNVIYNLYVKNSFINQNEELKDAALEYIDDYINYVFYKRSYPNINTALINKYSGEEKKNISNSFENLKNNIDLEYSLVLKIRDINNFISNNSIYLLINIGCLIVFLVLAIIEGSIRKAFKLSGLALILSSLSVLIAEVLLQNYLLNSTNENIKYISVSILNQTFQNSFFNQALIYMGIGLVLFLTIYIREKLIRK
jgi:hypothetical protein